MIILCARLRVLYPSSLKDESSPSNSSSGEGAGSQEVGAGKQPIQFLYLEVFRRMKEIPITQINLSRDVIDLGVGDPDFNLLPLELLHRSAEAYFTAGDFRPLEYGSEQGNGYFRGALADFLEEAYHKSVDPDLLFITAGASSALDLICTLYTRPGDTIFIEEPTYFLALHIFADHGLRTVPIPMDDGGLRLEALEEKLAEHYPKFVYTIPTFHNPGGCTLSQARRDKLVELAQRYKFLVVADEVYHFLSYTQAPPPPFAVFADDVEQIISVNSFSKILAPGLRLGWIQTHRAVIRRLAGSGLLDSGGGMNPLMSALGLDLIKSGGLEQNIRRLRIEYASRLNALDAALNQLLPESKYTVPQGGFFFWVRIPGIDAADLRPKAQGFNVDFRQGALFSSRKRMGDFFRLSFCYYRPQDIEEGIKRLRDCLVSSSKQTQG
jgi:2-aminoadipate transaminase